MSGHSSHTSVEAIAVDIVQSLEPCSELALPSVAGIVRLAQDTRELLFPGFGDRRRLLNAHDQLLESTVLIREIESRLRLEVGRALNHAEQTTLKIHGQPQYETQSADHITEQFLQSLPILRRTLMTDVEAAFDGDPAACTNDEILLCYPGLQAIFVYRMAHELHQLNVPYLPRILTEWAHRETGIDIHPAAKIGPRFFIDHGTGVVIGETCEIGACVTLYQGVTLGAWSFPRDEDGNLIRGSKRHPTLQDGVTVYSNATILGGTTVVGTGARIGSSVTLSRSVPPHSIVTIDQPSLRIREVG